MPHTCRHISIPLLMLLLAGCAFDVIKIEKVPATLAPAPKAVSSFTLRKPAVVNLSTGYSRTLKAATVWHPVGSLPQGTVFETEHQVLTIEGSNVYEAYIVVNRARLVGFFLPANSMFSPLDPATDLDLLTSDGKTQVPMGER